jgi:hypothetical protein
MELKFEYPNIYLNHLTQYLTITKMFLPILIQGPQ